MSGTKARLAAASLFVMGLIPGCGQGLVSPAAPNSAFSGNAPQANLAVRHQQLQQRANSLDRDNQELESLLAQSRQQSRLLKDELSAVRSQFRESNRRLAELQKDRDSLAQRTRTLAASSGGRTRATITANNSLLGGLAMIDLPGVEVRQDGDVIRIELPGQKLFHAGSTTLTPGAAAVVDGVVADVLRNYPEQVIGIEGHTDNKPIRTAQFPSNQHLSIGRAMAVYGHIGGRMRISSKQFFVVGHGANHPVVSNATPSGQTRNRRVELVVYPERWQ